MESGTSDILDQKKVQAFSSTLGKKDALLERIFGVWLDSFLD
ncbi:MAG: hypothetical protein Q8L68_01420 [Methylococcales bacterium]|nr:hypothetical protein [Methylococcales bacterium]